MRWIAPVLACLLALPSGPLKSAHQEPERIPASVRDHVVRRVDSGRPLGIVIGVVDAAGASYFARGRMWAEGPAVAEDTLFEIGSITKVFTATLLADLALQGVVALDEPVAGLMPPGSRMPSQAGRAFTLADLATHRSGLPRLPEGFDPPDPENPFAAYGETELLAFLGSHQLSQDAAPRYEYSNLGFGLLGYALARRAGSAYEELVVERIADPLGMTDTRVRPGADQQARLARGHSGGRPVSGWDFDALAGAGGLRSSARDLVRFLSAHMGLVENPVPGLAKTREQRLATGVPDLWVALGWHLWTRHGRDLYWHNGGTGGYRSFCGFDPERRVGVVVLANGSEEIDAVGLHLLDSRFELTEPRAVAAVDEATLDELVGWYELGPGVLFHITREGDQLFAQLTGQARLPVYPENPRRFFYDAVDAKLSFTAGAEGGVEGLVLHQNGQHPARRLEDYEPPVRVEVQIEPAVLARYVGRYELSPGVVFDVALEGERLAVQLADQPRFPVYAESATEFFYRVVEAELTFVVDDEGRVTGLVLHQGGIDQSAQRLR